MLIRSLLRCTITAGPLHLNRVATDKCMLSESQAMSHLVSSHERTANAYLYRIGLPYPTFPSSCFTYVVPFPSIRCQTFALTGNLAASWLASVLPQLLLLVYIVRGPMVLLERSSPTLEQNSGTENDSKELIDKKGNGDAN